VRRTLSWIVACLAAATGSVVALTGPAAAAAPVGRVPIFSRHMGKYVSAELGFTGSLEGMLRGRSDTVGRWESFNIDFVPGSTVYQRIGSEARVSGDAYSNLNKSLVQAELNYPGGDDGMARAMGSPNDGYQTSEQFLITSVGGGWYTIKSRVTGKYWEAESGYANERDGMIRAAGSDPASWTTHFRFF
jgi:hypothetical protein